MAITRRLIKIYWDMAGNQLFDSAGQTLAYEQYPAISYQENVLINLYLYDGAIATAYTGLQIDGSFQATLDYDYDPATAPMCSAVNSDINIAGDFDGGNADVANGEISIRLNANTAAYQTAIGTSGEKESTYLELRCTDPASGTLVSVIRIRFRAYNLMDAVGTPSPAYPVVIAWDGDDVILKNSSGVIVGRFSPGGA
jgi:hypothetical protein